MAQAMNIPCIKVPGYEADDLIASYAKLAVAQGHKVRPIAVSVFLLC